MTPELSSAFFERLAIARSSDGFAMVKVGLTALELYANLSASDFAQEPHGVVLAHIVRDLNKIRGDGPVRYALERLLQIIPVWRVSRGSWVARSAIYEAVLRYGDALATEAEWELARLIYTDVAIDSELDYDVATAARARFAAGRANRMCANWKSADACYARSTELGIESGDLFTAFRAQLGQAAIKRERGDLPAAERKVRGVIRAAKHMCPEAAPHALLELAGLVHAQGQYERAIDLARQTLELGSEDEQVRSHALVDIANFLTDYGLPEVAREALRIVATTAAERGVQTHALLNLFFLATQAANSVEMESLQTQLRGITLTPRQQTQFALFFAQGLRRTNRLLKAGEILLEARELATRYELFQLTFEVEAETALLRAATDAGMGGNHSGGGANHGKAKRLPVRIHRAVELVHDLSVATAAHAVVEVDWQL